MISELGVATLRGAPSMEVRERLMAALYRPERIEGWSTALLIPPFETALRASSGRGDFECALKTLAPESVHDRVAAFAADQA